MNKNRAWGVLVCFCLIISQAFAGQDLDEANAQFTYKGKPIHPGLVQEFLSWISDPGEPTTVSVDVSARHRNEYDDDEVEIDGKSVCAKVNGDEGIFCYEWLGKSASGVHVLEVSDSGGGSGVFMDLILVKFSDGEILLDDKKEKQLLMTVVGRYTLGDRYDGEITVYPDKVVASASKNQQHGGLEKAVELRFP